MNTVCITGRLVRDPESRSSAGGSVVHITVAVDGYNASTKQKQADFIPVVVFGKQAEFVQSYGEKGREVSVAGRLRQSSWEDRSTGEKKSRLEVIADRVEFHGPKSNGKAGGGDDFSLI